MPDESPVCSGLVERIGLENSYIKHKVFSGGPEQLTERSLHLADHEAGLNEVVKLLSDPKIGVINNPEDIQAVAHRVVHGGERFSETTFITKAVKEDIKKLFPLAPLHNPPNYVGIEVSERLFENAKQVAVFDTAFHQGMPEAAFRYAVPKSLYTEDGIRAYGFHGTSHKYVSEKAIEFLRNPEAKIITIHLGNGASMAAIKNGRSVDTSMGFGPLSGLIMGTRSGDIDASVIFHLTEQLGYDAQQASNLLNKQSGMLGLSGHSDMRDIRKAIEEGNEDAKLAYDMYAYRIKKYIGAYAAVLNGLDAVVFTAGIGENDNVIRERVCTNMEFLGMCLNPEKNDLRKNDIHEISTDESSVKILVIPTNEELEIARQCYSLLNE